jgi:hypothetical protein
MEELVKKMVKDFIVEQVLIEFKAYITKHFNSLETDEKQDAFLGLLQNDDEYTEAILKRLNDDFNKEVMTDEKMESLRKKAFDMFNTVDF